MGKAKSLRQDASHKIEVNQQQPGASPIRQKIRERQRKGKRGGKGRTGERKYLLMRPWETWQWILKGQQGSPRGQERREQPGSKADGGEPEKVAQTASKQRFRAGDRVKIGKTNYGKGGGSKGSGRGTTKKKKETGCAGANLNFRRKNAKKNDAGGRRKTQSLKKGCRRRKLRGSVGR